MGLFSRNEASAGSGRRSAVRTSSEAQAAELRIRARRRLIGALVLVVTAIVVVPMLFDAPPEEQLPTPVVLPEVIPPMPAEPQVAVVTGGQTGSSGQSAVQTPADPSRGTVTDMASTATTESHERKPEGSASAESQSGTSERKPAEAQKPQATRPAAPKPSTNDRTDDGAVALALLEGRTPPAAPARSSSAASSGGSVVLQVAAYTTNADAQSRRDKLVAAGVTNAYVEQASLGGGKTAYRLRVGPFPTRDAAEAVQARLRQLGYDNSLIYNK